MNAGFIYCRTFYRLGQTGLFRFRINFWSYEYFR